MYPREKKTQMNIITSERGNIVTNNTKILKIIRNFYEQQCNKKLDKRKKRMNF